MSCNQNCSWLWSPLVLRYILMTGTSCFIYIKSAQREINYCQWHKNGVWIFKSAGLQENWIPPPSFNRNLDVTHFLTLWVYTVPLPSGFEQSQRYTRDLRSEDGEGRENVAEKANSRSFNLHGDYSKSLTLSNIGEPSLSWLRRSRVVTHGAKKCTKIVQRYRTAVADPYLEITGGEGGGGVQRNFFRPFVSQFGL